MRIRIFKSDAETEQQIVYMLPIEANAEDAHGNHISDADVEKAAYSFMEAGGQINIEHLDGTVIPTVVVESSIARSNYELGGHKVKKGDWMLAVKIKDDAAWQKIKKGEFKGCSIEGAGIMVLPEAQEIYKSLDDVPAEFKSISGVDLSLEQANLLHGIFSEVTGAKEERVNKAKFLFTRFMHTNENKWVEKSMAISKASSVYPIEQVSGVMSAVKEAVKWLSEKFGVEIKDDYASLYSLEHIAFTGGSLWSVSLPSGLYLLTEKEEGYGLELALLQGSIYYTPHAIDAETAERLGWDNSAWREWVISKLEVVNKGGLTLVISN